MKKIVFALLAAAVVLGARAQTNMLSLDGAKRLAFERNWDLLAAKSGVEAATAQLLAAREFPNPNLAISSAKIGDHQGNTPLGNGIWERNYDTIFAVNQLIEVGGKRHDRQVAGRAGVLGSKARFFDAKRLLDQGVTKAYVAALLADENVRTLRESAGYMQHEQDIAETRFGAGDLAESDLKQIQVAAGQYILQANAAEVTAVQARIAVDILLGTREPKGDWQPSESLEQISGGITFATESEANAVRPDVLAAETDFRVAEANLKLQKANRIPDPTVALQYEHEPPGGGPPVNTIGLGVSFPLPLWNLNKGRIDAAKAELEQSDLAVAKIRAQAAGDLAVAGASYREAEERLKRYREKILPQSASARKSLIYKFEKGGATLVELLTAERTDNDVRIATAQAMADAASTAADLTAAKTTLTETELSARK